MAKFVEKRKHWWWVKFIIDMHSSESQTSWTRWMGTFIVSNIMIMWTLNCIFGNKLDDKGKVIGQMIDFSLVDMPTGLVAIILGVAVAKVAQSGVEKYVPNGKKEEGADGP